MDGEPLGDGLDRGDADGKRETAGERDPLGEAVDEFDGRPDADETSDVDGAALVVEASDELARPVTETVPLRETTGDGVAAHDREPELDALGAGEEDAFPLTDELGEKEGLPVDEGEDAGEADDERVPPATSDADSEAELLKDAVSLA